MTWDEKFEVVSFAYDATQVDRAAVDAAIETLGYGTEEPGAATTEPAPAAASAASAVIPEAVRALFEQAAKEGKLVALKFTATWCAPCKAMTTQTIHHPDVAAVLAAKFVFREIDTDELPAVSKAFGVNGIPDTRFLTPDGVQIDTIRGFEGPEPFLKRLQSVQKK